MIKSVVHCWTINLALIRGLQVIHGMSAGVRSAGEGAVRGFAALQKAQCKVRSIEEGTVRRYAGKQKNQLQRYAVRQAVKVQI